MQRVDAVEQRADANFASAREVETLHPKTLNSKP
jgi:hypothetical protein